MARVLFYTTYNLGLGADRWIVQGYENAFLELGHEFFTTESEKYPLEKKLREIRPDIFVAPVEGLCRRNASFLDILKDLRAHSAKTFFFVDTNFRDYLEFINGLEKEHLADFYFGYYAPEFMRNFENVVGKNYHLIPLAANHKLHFPVKANPEYEADISFIGNRLPAKEKVFKELLFPLFRKYRVRIYGPGWTLRDKILRIASGIGRKSGFFKLADLANRKRVMVALEDERRVYSSSKICLNIHEHYPSGRSKNFSNEREFKIPACGGFQVSDYVVGIERFFVPDKEIVLARGVDKWFGKIEFYMKNDAARKKIQEAGTRRALREHTYKKRAEKILSLASSS